MRPQATGPIVPRALMLATTAVALLQATIVLSADRPVAPPVASSTPGDWSSFAPITPEGRTGHAVAFDASRTRLVLIGGRTSGGADANDVWTLSLPQPATWTQLPVTGDAPSPRESHTAVYDLANDRVLVFGGFPFDAANGAVYALSFATNTWSLLTSGSGPSPRYGHTTIFDPISSSVVLFGGYDASDTYLNDVWMLSLTGTPTWTQLTPSGTPPSGRRGHGAIFDPTRNRMLVYGGESGGGETADTWQLSFSDMTWMQRATTPNPGPRFGIAAAYDASRDRFVIFGGHDPATNADLNDLWVLSLSDSAAWGQVSLPGLQPPTTQGAVMRYDPPRDRFVVIGGSPDYVQGGGPVSVWAVSANFSSPWDKLNPAPRTAPALVGAAGAWDSRRARTIVVHGCSSNGVLVGDVWAMSMQSGSPVWTAIALSGGPPAPRAFHSAVYDSMRDQVVVFGGTSSLKVSTPLNDAWALTFTSDNTATWSMLAPSGTPPAARAGHVAVLDAVNDRMLVMCGGADPLGGSGLNDVWALSLAGSTAWSPVAPSGTPPSARVGTSVALDTAGRRALITGGVSDGAYLNDAWSLALDGGSDWSMLAPAGTAPTARRYAAAAYDGLRNRVVVFGGEDAAGNTLDDTSELLAGASPLWAAPTPGGVDPGARRGAVAALDAANDRLIVFGGSRNVGGYGELRLRDVAMLSWNNIVGVPQSPVTRGSLALGAVAPSPAHRGRAVRVEMTLTSDAPVLVQVLDVRGRVIAQRTSEAADAVSITLDRSTAPGVYVLRVAQARRTASRAIAVID